MTNETRDSLLLAMKSLPEDQRRVLVMRDVMNLDYPDISEIMDIPEESVHSLVDQARSFVANAVPTE